ncbi:MULTISPECIES: DNA polymerase III subunit delta [unclassified Sphingomonas]|uniref:DNA polymerase III subunit delta n=1 Tax=unclassified Sphingomonas TaxID=196159 RepID=UPI000832F2E8|nr:MULTISPECIES: DNA polymerase III subunit delta [unclassified Sphingomonas]
MKIKEGIAARLDRPGDDVRLYLLHGPDEAGAAELAARLARAMGEGAERVDLDGATLRGRPGLLAEEAASMSLFGERRHIRVTGVGDESLAAVEQLLAADRAGNPAVMIAPALKGTSKLLKLVAAAPNALAYACYVPEGQAATRIAAEAGRAHGITLNQDVAERLMRACNGDRAVMARELEKLALFLDAAPDAPRVASVDDLRAVCASVDEAEPSAAIQALVAGDSPALAGELVALTHEGVSMISVVRQLGRRLHRLAELRAEVDRGRSIHEVIERAHLFWKDKEPTRQALQHWNAPRLSEALARLGRIERDLKASGTAGEVAGAAELLGMTRRRRR